VSYEPLHHKYRPQTFADLVGQEAIATTLTNAIRTERIAPAYLFTGPRGTGKTSSARILAKSLNCLQAHKPTESPCGVCEVCTRITSGSALDVIEIDAASNTGVDNIREIIERAQFAPVQCRYKVYVIDECHMLSAAAFNALLKTLEEPPARVVFVLATTDPQRVLPTIISRCQRFDFRRIPLEEMVNHLSEIAAKENINIAPDAVTLVAQIAQGGLRDAESLLDQLSLLTGGVTVEAVWDLVGAVPERDLLTLTRAIAGDDPQAVLDQCRRLMDRGREPLVVLQNLAGFYRDLLIAKTAPKRNDLVAVTPPTWNQLCEFVQQLNVAIILQGQQHLKNSEAQVKNTTQPRLWLEVTLLGLLPSALSANLVVRNEAGSQSLVESKTSIRNRPETSRVPRGSTAGRVSAELPNLTHSTDPTTHPQQPAHPTVPANDSSTTGVSPTPLQAPIEKTPKVSPSAKGAPPDAASATVRSEEADPTPAVSQSVVSRNDASREQAAQSAVDPHSADLEQVWQQVLNHIKLFSTQQLLRQHCSLLSFNGSQATIAISSKKLLKLAQDKLPDIEAAFEAVHKFKVKVSLKPGTSETAKTAPADAQPFGYENSVAAPNPLPSSQTRVTEQTPQATVTTAETNEPPTLGTRQDPSDSVPLAFSNGYAERGSFASSAAVATPGASELAGTRPTFPGAPREQRTTVSPQVQVEIESGGSRGVVPQPPMSLPTQEVDWEADEVDKALANLKQFFEGEIVALTDDYVSSEPSTSHQPQGVQANDADTDHPELAPEEYWEEPNSIEQAATHQMQSSEIAACDNAQTRLERESWQYDEDGDIAF
jgi:DNA polymerase-3 subunit gamma/tau